MALLRLEVRVVPHLREQDQVRRSRALQHRCQDRKDRVQCVRVFREFRLGFVDRGIAHQQHPCLRAGYRLAHGVVGREQRGVVERRRVEL